MAGLVVFTIFAAAGCGFLIYFVVALWRDSQRPRNGVRVEIRAIAPARLQKAKLHRLYSVNELHVRENKQL
jgi:threonine/homoserine/homoserine lactone efflux protein